jgi:hypothetical protein
MKLKLLSIIEMFEMILKLHEVMIDSYYSFLDLKISITDNLHYHISSPLL